MWFRRFWLEDSPRVQGQEHFELPPTSSRAAKCGLWLDQKQIIELEEPVIWSETNDSHEVNTHTPSLGYQSRISLKIQKKNIRIIACAFLLVHSPAALWLLGCTVSPIFWACLGVTLPSFLLSPFIFNLALPESVIRQSSAGFSACIAANLSSLGRLVVWNFLLNPHSHNDPGTRTRQRLSTLPNE